MNIRYLWRLRRWAEKPPSASRMILIVTIAALGFLIYGLEHFGYWPDWATAENAKIKQKKF
ncbi:MAG: hypothetical protein ABJI95_10425 [Paracoccaceae bacterium]